MESGKSGIFDRIFRGKTQKTIALFDHIFTIHTLWKTYFLYFLFAKICWCHLRLPEEYREDLSMMGKQNTNGI